jgi:hypothetical protein
MSELPERPSLEQLQKQAKDLLRRHRAADPAALLADAQFVIAREHGFDTWAKLKHHITALAPSPIDPYDEVAKEIAAAYSSGDSVAIREINWNHGTSFVWDREPVDMQRRLPAWFASDARTPDLAESDARKIVAHSYGFDSWAQFAASVNQPPADPRSAAIFLSSTPPFYKIDWKENRLSVRGLQSPRDWDTIAAVMREHRIVRLQAGGMSDAGLDRISRLDHVTHLHIGGNALTDDGAQHLARMPQLLDLDLGGWTSPLTDRALEPLHHLTALERFAACWTQRISDAGLSNLASCDRLVDVNLLGTPAGDGAVRALIGKPRLRHLNTGHGTTDAGLALFHQFPVFETWHGGEIKMDLMTFQPEPNHLLLDGPFTDAGLAALAGLGGLFGLSFFWHCPAFTSAGLEPLKHLPNLGFLGCQDQHGDDEAMRHIAAIPRLRMLMGQGAVATDAGFAALSRSQSIEYLWGRDCPNLAGNGFTALAAMPVLRGLGVSCKNVDDASLSLLPQFPALRELMPMDVQDAGFRHLGRCENLESLWCMYCRETGDLATEHIAAVPRLKRYYAGQTKITDRSLEILSRMPSLERLEFWNCSCLTNAGVAHLAALPRLREITLDGLSGVTREAVARFRAQVRVNYSG